MKKKPTKKQNPADEKKQIDDFINGAEKKTQANSYPWQSSTIDDSKTKVFNLKLPESYSEKLDFLVKNTVPKISKQRFLLEKILPFLDEELKKRNFPK